LVHSSKIKTVAFGERFQLTFLFSIFYLFSFIERNNVYGLIWQIYTIFSAHIHLAFYFHFQNCNSHNIFFRTKIIPNAPWMSPCQTQLPLCIGGGFFAHP
jgi:hypothetical protein